jgi:hypothetical protein
VIAEPVGVKVKVVAVVVMPVCGLEPVVATGVVSDVQVELEPL